MLTLLSSAMYMAEMKLWRAVKTPRGVEVGTGQWWTVWAKENSLHPIPVFSGVGCRMS